MTNIQNLPGILTKDERKMLYENWNGESWKEIVERNLKFAIKYAKKFQNTGIDEDDLIGISFLGLCKAARKFNPKLGYEFLTYAEPVIRNEIFLELRKMRKNPYTDISLDDILINDSGEEFSLKEIVSENFSIEEHIICEDLKKVIKEIYSRKRRIEQKVISGFINGKTQTEIGNEIGISQSYASRILKNFKNEIAKKWSR